MNIRKSFRRYCALTLIVAFTSTHLAAQTLSPPATATQGQAASGNTGAIHLAAAIGIVKPESASEGESETTSPAEPPVAQAPQTEEVEPAAQTSGMGVSKLAIGVGVGLAALLAAVAGGGGGGSGGSTPPSHSAP